MPALHVPRSLSYSALALHDRCGFSYYAERVVGLRPQRSAAGALRGALLGDAVHRAVAVGVERACQDLGRRRSSDRRGARRGLGAVARCRPALRAAGSIAHEVPFAFCEQDVVVRGSLDVCVRDGDGAVLIADLKTTALGGA